MKKTLLLIDVQNDYFPNGKCQLYEQEVALNAIKSLYKFATVMNSTAFS